jgi:ABC-type polysaccharide/polyol phosphate export permease
MLGMFLGQLFREEQSATIAAVSLLALLLFFSGIIIPLESLPQSFLSINFYNPFMMSISLIRANTFFDTSFAYLGNIYLALLLMTTIFYSLTMALVFRQNRRVDN